MSYKTIVEDRLYRLENADKDFEDNLYSYHHYNLLKELIPVAIEQQKYRALTRIFDFYEIPKNLSIKERICYYQLLES